MFAIVVVYLWTMLEKRMNRYSKPAGVAALVWRFVLTSGTGSIFAFLVARQAYASAVLVPLFIAMSLSWGMATFLLAQAALQSWRGSVVAAELRRRLKNLLGIFIALVLWLTATYHLTNIYFARQIDFERFILLDGGVYPLLFWLGYVLLGSIAPMWLLWRRAEPAPATVLAAAALVVAGAFAQLYVFIIGGQAFPLDIFPGFDVTSSFRDGEIGAYRPSVWEVLLGLGGIAAAFVVTLIGAQVLDILPDERAAGGR
jgi:molybdopterin-containing oxidoreductase family membrane subunit